MEQRQPASPKTDALTLGPAILAIGLMGTLGLIGDLPYAAADAPLGPPRSKSTPGTQVTSPHRRTHPCLHPI